MIRTHGDHHQVSMLRKHSTAIVLETLVGRHRHDVATLLQHEDPTAEVPLSAVAAPGNETGDDLANLVEPRCVPAAEVERLENPSVVRGGVSKDHSSRAGIARVRPFDDQVLLLAGGAAATFRPFARLRSG